VPKQCPAACSGAGTCVYRDRNNNIVPSCLSQSSSCFASCVCNANAYGSACSLTQDNFMTARRLREVFYNLVIYDQFLPYFYVVFLFLAALCKLV
jgi:hypothetical protein